MHGCSRWFGGVWTIALVRKFPAETVRPGANAIASSTKQGPPDARTSPFLLTPYKRMSMANGESARPDYTRRQGTARGIARKAPSNRDRPATDPRVLARMAPPAASNRSMHDRRCSRRVPRPPSEALGDGKTGLAFLTVNKRRRYNRACVWGQHVALPSVNPPADIPQGTRSHLRMQSFRFP